MEIIKRVDKNFVVYSLSVFVLFFFFTFFLTCTQIGYGVKNRCDLAQDRYGGECVDALMAQVADDSTQAGKNDAIWALGQMGDERALPFLRQYVMEGEIPDREAWDEGVSQYELQKAVKLLEGGWNISAFIWR